MIATLVRLTLALAALDPDPSSRAADPRPPAQPDDRAAVVAVVQRMFDAMRARDTAAVRAVFEPGARLVGMRVRANGDTVVQTLSVDQWVSFIGRDSRGEWLERAFEPEVRLDATLATVWAAYDFHLAGKFSHCGTDAVQLLRLPQGWRIVSIADTYRTTGCPRRAPPA
jgi:hypothetical protein